MVKLWFTVKDYRRKKKKNQRPRLPKAAAAEPAVSKPSKTAGQVASNNPIDKTTKKSAQVIGAWGAKKPIQVTLAPVPCLKLAMGPVPSATLAGHLFYGVPRALSPSYRFDHTTYFEIWP
jgi:hypothetical protein